jgi:hypothetical protein
MKSEESVIFQSARVRSDIKNSIRQIQLTAETCFGQLLQACVMKESGQLVVRTNLKRYEGIWTENKLL